MSSESLDNVIKTVQREYKWPPDKIDGLFFDRADHHGLLWYYDDILHLDNEQKKKLDEIKEQNKSKYRKN